MYIYICISIYISNLHIHVFADNDLYGKGDKTPLPHVNTLQHTATHFTIGATGLL